MKSNNYGKILTCFFGCIFSPIAMSFNPDNDFSRLLHSNETKSSNEDQIKFISSSINLDKTQALVCFINAISEGKCFYYNLNENIMTELSRASNNCSLSGYGLNTYFFEKNNEYIFSCVDKDSKLFMKRMNSFFEVIEDDIFFNGKQFTDCEDYSSFSIVYISQYNQYFTMINANCNGKNNIYFFLLSDNCSPQTTNAQIITTQIKIETTLPAIETTSPQIITTQPKIETTLPIIKTTSPQIITTHLKIDTTLPIIKTTSSKLLTTQLEIDSTLPSRKSDKIDSSTESLCKEVGKIYMEGKCICDTDNEFYSINSRNYENKCYKKSDLPKNVYYNNLKKNLMNYAIKHVEHALWEVIFLKIIV